MAGKNLALTDYLSRHPTEEATTEENHVEEYLINTLSELFKLNHIYGQLLNTDRKFQSTNQSADMTLKVNRESTNEIALPKKFISDTNSKVFTSKQAQTVFSKNTESNPINARNSFDFDFTNSKMEKQFNYKYDH